MEDSPLHFARPLWLYAGPVLCVALAWMFSLFDRRREAAIARLVHPRFRQKLMPGFSKLLQRTRRTLWLLGVLLLCVAAAGPRKGYEWREVKRRGIDLLFAVDTSRSMLAEDLKPNRLERARMGIHDFVSRMEGDRVGLIPFAGSAYALCPLTLDYDAFRESLDALDTDLIPRQGTDVASAILEAERLFRERGGNHRILVLITDGEDLQGDAVEAAETAAGNGMTIHAVGVGSTEGAVIPLAVPEGGSNVVMDEAGNPVRTRLDEATLRKIAEVTGGIYAPLGRGAEGLETIHTEKLRLVPKSETDQRMEKVPLERFEWPLAAALLLLLMEFLLPERRREAAVRMLPSAARRHPAATVLLAAGLWLAVSPQPARAEAAADPRALYNQGTAEFMAGDFKKAAESLRSSLNTPDLGLQGRAYYNLGNSLYRMGQAVADESPGETIKFWEEAIKAYGDALSLNSADSDARYNQDFVKRKLEELKKKQQENQKQDDQQKPNEEKNDKQEEQNKDQKNQSKSDKSDGAPENQEEQNQEKSDGQQSGDKPEKNQDQKNDDPRKQEQSSEGDSQKPEQGPENKNDEARKDQANGKPEEKDADKKKPAGAGGQDEKKESDGAETGKEQTEPEAPGDDGKKQESRPGSAGQEKEGPESEPKEPRDGTPAGDEEATGDSDKSAEAAGMSDVRRTAGEMTAAEARQLLQALRSDERTVIPFERPRRQSRFRDPNNTIKGKTW